MAETGLTAAAKRKARTLGADLFGVADLALARDLPTEPADLFDGMKRAAVVGVKLLDAVVEQCTDGPTLLYEQHYHQVNARLDAIADGLARFLEGKGGRALPIPASQMLDRAKLTAHVSHKALGRLAGLGWQGKSLLLVNPRIGPRFRMAAVLTDLDLTPAKPLKNRCGSCRACTEACPASAIRGVSTRSHYASREEALDFAKCASMCMEVFAKRPGFTKPVCGVCVRVCPHGRRR